MTLEELFPKSRLLLEIKAKDKVSAIQEMLDHLVAEGGLTKKGVEQVAKCVHERESQGSTGIGKGLAIPHAKNCSGMEGILGVFGRSREGIPFDSVDGGKVQVLFLVVSGPGFADAHMGVLRKLALLLRDEKTLRFLARTDNRDGMVEIFREIDVG